MAETPGTERRGAVEYEHVGEEYLRERELHRRAGVALIWGLGVGFVISGEYFSWNFGLANGGFGGMLIATLLAIAMYVFMVYSISEMATAFPVTGGPYAFARRTMGPWGGFATGIGAILEYVFATAALCTVIAGIIVGIFAAADVTIDAEIVGLQPIEWIAVLLFLIFVVINLMGVQATLVSVFAITVVSVGVLLLWGLVLLLGGHFDTANFNNIAPEAGNGTFLPFGFAGILTALPFAFWFYLAIEGVPLASEETKDPSNDLPKGSILAMWTLVVLSGVALFVGAGAGGADVMSGALAPLSEAVNVTQGENWLWWIVTVAGLTGFLASFHSIIFAFSRIIYALSRAGYLPRFLSLTSARKAPYFALIIPSVLGLIAAIVYIKQDPANAVAVLTEMSVFGALTTYVLMMLAFIILRQREPNVTRPYRSPVGIPGAVVALIIAVVCGVAQLYYEGKVLGARAGVVATIIVLAVGFIYFGLYSRHHLVAEAPEEEFAVIAKAEAELEVPPPPVS
jgi:ethanolamine permease